MTSRREAVNCVQECGFGPCSAEIRRENCSGSCSVVGEDEADNYTRPGETETAQQAVCSEWEEPADEDTGTEDSGTGDAGFEDAGDAMFAETGGGDDVTEIDQ